jgi:acyl-CoA synthetase (NDP forming)
VDGPARPRSTGPDPLDEDLREDLVAARPALDAFLHPRSIAVVGASADPETLPGYLFSNLVNSGFAGTLLPVNRRRRLVQGVPAYPDLSSCPVAPDLVIACVPAPAVLRVVAEAGELGIKAVCVISAGFAETGATGASLQAGLAEEARARGVRLVGPNCTGIVSGAGSLRFNTTFSRTVPPPGSTCMLTQSGAFGLDVLEAMDARGLGIGSFVSVGNTIDLGVLELLAYWGDDPSTRLVMLYLETVPDAQKFVRLARHVSRKVPIVALKAGRTKAGQRGAASHTAALASADVAVDAVLRQAGVVRVASMEEALDVATILGVHQRFRGRGVAIVTNGGGAGVIAADACEDNGLAVPELAEPTRTALRSIVAPEASVANPVDMIASATAPEYGEVVRTVGCSPEIDAVAVLFNIPVLTRGVDVANELVAARQEVPADVPIVAVFINREGPPAVLRQAGIPGFVFPENAARALGHVMAWHERRERLSALTVRPEVDKPAVGRLLAEAVPRASRGWLATGDAEALLGEYGVAVPRSVRVKTPAEAGAAQAELGGPVVVKAASAVHKSEVGAVKLGVTTQEGAAAAVWDVRANLEAAGLLAAEADFLVQEQVSEGQEMIVGVNRDPLLGPLVVVGAGGRLVEVLADVAVRLAPLSEEDIAEMVGSLRSLRLLTGYRGEPPADIDALYAVLRAVSAIAEDLPQIVEMDLNPLFVLRKGAVAADVRIRVMPGRAASA